VTRRILREPLLHFFALGLVLFALFALVDDSPPPRQGEQIQVTDDDARRLAAGFEATWRRPPTVEEIDRLIESYIEEEVYVREALALGLDQDDAVIRQRLRQKMEFLTEAAADTANPSEQQLRRHYEAHEERFAEDARIAFEQVYLGEEPGDGAIEAAAAALAEGAPPHALGRSSLLPVAQRLAPATAVDGAFGDGFFERIAALEADAWTGPVPSAFGLHLVRVKAAEKAKLPPFEAVRDAVERDWRLQTALQLGEERYAAFRARYEVTRPEAKAILGR
jgi:hypothetical protein